MKKGYFVAVIAAAMTVGSAMTSFAGWQSDANGWWWQNEDGSYPSNGWQWIDGNGDGVSESYYFGPDGYMYANTTTPDGYTVNVDGAWTVNGVVQTQTTQPAQTTNTDVMTGYNADGISNAAIDMLNHTQAENTKYGEVSVYNGNGVYGLLNRVVYSNGLTVEYYLEGSAYNNGLPERVYTQTPSNIIQDINNSVNSAEEAEEALRNSGFNRSYNNGVNAWSVIDPYYIDWNPRTSVVFLTYAD